MALVVVCSMFGMKSAPLKTDADGMSVTFVALTRPGFIFKAALTALRLISGFVE
jgi:hypothetical protein